jgi:thiol-disulfide isomerase/thioredoxin
MTLRSILQIACAAVLVHAASGCGGQGAAPGTPPAASPAPAPPSAANAVGAIVGGPGPIELRPASAADLQREIATPGARATLVNVWATWCGPCRAEFPALVQVWRDQAPNGLRVMLVSADMDTALVRPFLERYGVGGPQWLMEGDPNTFINTMDPRWTGAIPATFVYDDAGKLTDFWEGSVDHATFEKAVLKAMGGEPVAARTDAGETR